MESMEFTVTDNNDVDVTNLCTYELDEEFEGLVIENGAIVVTIGSTAAGTYERTLTATYGELTATATIQITVTN